MALGGHLVEVGQLSRGLHLDAQAAGAGRLVVGLVGRVHLGGADFHESAVGPLVFRLVISHGPRHPIYLITSIQSAKSLSDRDVRELYRKRWGIELFYRHLKQTFQKRKLRSLTAANAQVALEWSLVGLWGLGLSAAVEIAKHHVPLSRISVSSVLRAFRRLMKDYLHPADRRHSLCALLRQALVDTDTRQNKSSQDYPRKSQHERTRTLTIAKATAAQVKQAKTIKRLNKG